MYLIMDFINDLKILIEIVKIEIQNREMGIPGDGTVTQLNDYIMPELIKLLNLAEENNLPQKDKRWVVSNWSIIHEWLPDWDWSNPSDMMLKIKELDEKFRNKLKLPLD